MICRKCGENNPDDAKFCTNCGSPLIPETEPVQSTETPEPETVTASVSEPKQKPAGPSVTARAKALPKKVRMYIGIALAAVLLLVVLIATSKPTIDLNKYLVVEADGYNGYGTAAARIDWDGLNAKYGSKLKFTSDAKKEYGPLLAKAKPVDVLKESVSVNLQDNKNLSNGDEIQYTWKVDEEYISKYIKCKVKYKDKTYKVADLAKVETFDAFADLKVTFEGVAPNGRALFEYTGSDLSSYAFKCDKTNGLKNGDTVVVHVDEDAVKECARKNGKVPEPAEMTFTVEGLESYVTSLSEIDEASMNAMQAQAADAFNAYVAKRWEDYVTADEFTYVGDYLLTAKDPANSWNQNQLYLVYRVKAHIAYTQDEETFDEVKEFYWYIAYDGLMVGADGVTKVNTTDYRTVDNQFIVDSGISDGWFSTQRWYFRGFETIDELYKNCVTADSDAFNHEDNVTIE